MVDKVLFSSNSDEWSTPKDLFDKLNYEYQFTLDPCASHDNHKCDKYFTIDDDGLKQEWHGSVFINPPYSDIKSWIRKAYEESKKDYCTRTVLLIPSRTDTSWFHDYVSQAYEIKFIRGRLKFGDAKNSAPFPSAVVVFDKKGSYIDPSLRFWDWKS